MTCNRIKAPSAYLLIIVAVFTAFLCCAPIMAFAGPLEAGSVDAGEQTDLQDGDKDFASQAHISYLLDEQDEQSWKADGATASGGSAGIRSLRMNVSGDVSGAVEYQAWLGGTGWQAVRTAGELAGASGTASHVIGAVRIALTGELSQSFDISYRVKPVGGSWQAWKKNGVIAGKVGGSVQSIQVKLVARAKKRSSAATGILGVRYRGALKSGARQLWVANNANSGKPGSGTHMTTLRAALDKGSLSGGISYRVRLSNGKWTAWKKNGAVAGTGRSVQAVQIKLTGAIAKRYDVVYRVYLNKVGWQGRKRNGATAGAGSGYHVEGVRIQLESKSDRSGWVGSGSNWSYYRNGKKLHNRWIKTAESPIKLTSVKSKRYWLDAKGKLATRRVVDPGTARDKGASKAYYVGKWGYPKARAKAKTSKGLVLTKAGGRLPNKSKWLFTSTYDDREQCYRLKKVGTYAIVQTGFFKVDGKRYYGIPNEGYILRNSTSKIGSKWYFVSADGVLSKGATTKTIVKRYVNWAIGIANDDSHGYSQDLALRWGPEYDCSSLVISSLKNTGLNVGYATYTGNMKSELTAHGFVWHTNFKKLKRGDILLVHNAGRQHTEIYLGKGKTVGAHIAETGKIYGKLGDQTGQEICIGPYYQIWEGYLRFGS